MAVELSKNSGDTNYVGNYCLNRDLVENCIPAILRKKGLSNKYTLSDNIKNYGAKQLVKVEELKFGDRLSAYFYFEEPQSLITKTFGSGATQYSISYKNNAVINEKSYNFTLYAKIDGSYSKIYPSNENNFQLPLITQMGYLSPLKEGRNSEFQGENHEYLINKISFKMPSSVSIRPTMQNRLYLKIETNNNYNGTTGQINYYKPIYSGQADASAITSSTDYLPLYFLKDTMKAEGLIYAEDCVPLDNFRINITAKNIMDENAITMSLSGVYNKEAVLPDNVGKKYTYSIPSTVLTNGNLTIRFNSGVTISNTALLKNKTRNSDDIRFGNNNFIINTLDPNSLYEINIGINNPVVKTVTVNVNVENYPNSEVAVYLPESKKEGQLHILNGSSGIFTFNDLSALARIIVYGNYDFNSASIYADASGVEFEKEEQEETDAIFFNKVSGDLTNVDNLTLNLSLVYNGSQTNALSNDEEENTDEETIIK